MQQVFNANSYIAYHMDLRGSEAATGGVLLKMVSTKISEISQEKTCIGVSFWSQAY